MVCKPRPPRHQPRRRQRSPPRACDSPATCRGERRTRDGVGLTGSLNRARLAAYGSAAKDVTWRIQGEFRTGSVGTGKASVSLQDAYIRYKPGQFGIQGRPVQDGRSPASFNHLAVRRRDRRPRDGRGFDRPKRDIGILADYAFGPPVPGAVRAVLRHVRADGQKGHGTAGRRADPEESRIVLTVTFCPSPLNTPSAMVAVGPKA